jgi:predicted ATPase
VLPLVDSATLTRLKEELFTTLGRSDRAVEACLDYLRHTGVRWSAHPAKEEVQQEYERLWRQIGSRSIADLVELPLMTDPEGRATMDVLTAVLAPAAHTDDDLLFLVVCRIANLSLEDGNSDGSCFAYVWLGTLLGIRFGITGPGSASGSSAWTWWSSAGCIASRQRSTICSRPSLTGRSPSVPASA